MTINVVFDDTKIAHSSITMIPKSYSGILIKAENDFIILDVSNIKRKHYVYINKNYISIIDFDESN